MTNATVDPPVARSSHESLRSGLARNAPVLSIALMLGVVIVGFALANDRFLTSDNILNVLRQSSPTLIVAIAATLVIASAGIDLSVGSIAAFAGTTTALLLREGLSPTVVVVLVLLIGAAIGLVNGYLIAYQGLPAFIVTLATLSIVLGAAQLQAKGFSIAIEDRSWPVEIAQGRLLGIPTAALVALLVAAVGWVVLARTAYGRHLEGIGSNAEAVRRAGVPTRRVVASVYSLSGLAAALAGILIAARLQAGSSTSGTGLELQVIAAVVLGGTSLFGGRATILGTLLGVMTIALINNGLILERVEPFYVLMVQGTILLLAIWANARLFSRWLKARNE